MICPLHSDDTPKALDCDGSCWDHLPEPGWLAEALEFDDDPDPYSGTYSEA